MPRAVACCCVVLHVKFRNFSHLILSSYIAKPFFQGQVKAMRDFFLQALTNSEHWARVNRKGLRGQNGVAFQIKVRF